MIQKIRIYVSCVCTYEIFFGKSIYNILYIIYIMLYMLYFVGYMLYVFLLRLPWCLSGKVSACQCRRRGFDPNVSGRSNGEWYDNTL